MAFLTAAPALNQDYSADKYGKLPLVQSRERTSQSDE